MKAEKLLLKIAFVLVSVIAVAACKREPEPDNIDFRDKFVGVYFGPESLWETDAMGNTTGPVTTQDTYEVELGPFPDKIRVNGVIFLSNKDGEYHGFEDEDCDSVSGLFTTGGFHYEKIWECSGLSKKTIFLGQKME